jgi:hypothetical protein
MGFALPWTDEQEGPPLPYQTSAVYRGSATAVRFGTFVGWDQHPKISDLLKEVDELSGGAFVSKNNFIAVEHQIGGHSCGRAYYFACPVEPTEKYLAFAASISSAFFHELDGWLTTGRDSDPVYLALDSDFKQRGAAMGLVAARPLVEAAYEFEASDDALNLFLCDPGKVRATLAPVLASPVAREGLRILILADNSD